MWNKKRIQMLRAQAIKSQGGKCFYCETPMGPALQHMKPSGLAATLDHKNPRSKNGRLHRTNVVAACTTCNKKKGQMTFEEFIRSPELDRIRTGRATFPGAPTEVGQATPRAER